MRFPEVLPVFLTSTKTSLGATMGEIGLESKVEMKLVHIRSGIGLVANVVSRGPFKMNAVFSNMVVSLKRRMIAKTR